MTLFTGQNIRVVYIYWLTLIITEILWHFLNEFALFIEQHFFIIK